MSGQTRAHLAEARPPRADGSGRCATLVEGKGVEGSANFGSHRQVTMIALERWLAMMAELGADVDPSAQARRSDGVGAGSRTQPRPAGQGRGSCLLRIGGEVKPCERMDEAYRGLREAMAPQWGGGAWGEVLRGGDIAVGDAVSWHGELFAE